MEAAAGIDHAPLGRLPPGGADLVEDQQTNGNAAHDDTRHAAVLDIHGHDDSAHQPQHAEDAKKMLQPTIFLIVDGNTGCHDPFSNGLSDARRHLTLSSR